MKNALIISLIFIFGLISLILVAGKVFNSLTFKLSKGVEIKKFGSTSQEIQDTSIQIEALNKIELFNSSFGDATAEIIGKDIDKNGNIRVMTQYKIDGAEVKSQYPLLDGKHYWVTRYAVQSFAEMTALQIKQIITKDMQDFAQELIRREYLEKTNTIK